MVVGRAHCDRGGTRGKVAVVYFSVRCGGVGGNQEPYWEPLTQFHSLLATQRSEKKVARGGDKKGRVEVDWRHLPSDCSPQGIKRKVEVKSMPTGPGKVKNRGEGRGERQKKQKSDDRRRREAKVVSISWRLV